MRWSLLLVVSFACAILEPASRSPTPGPGGLVEIEVKGQGIGGKRSAWVHAPAKTKGLPVVMAFHGGKGNTGLEMAPNWRHLFDKDIVFVFPNGQADDPKAAGWGGVGRSASAAEDMSDVRYVEALIDTLATTYGIDRARVYVAGHSNGGQFTWNLACEIPRKLAGAAVVSKSVPKALAEVCDPKGAKLPVIYFNGTADADTWKEGPYNLSAEETVAWWAGLQGCSQPRTVDLPDPSSDKMSVSKRVYDCPQPAAAEFFVIANGGHPWPTQHRKADARTCTDIDASSEILKFFGL